jgi:ABC-type transporter Mla subunit MlaD
MAKERNSLKVGIVTVITVVGAFAILLWISQSVGGEMQRITISFKPSAAMPTLAKGSAVLVGGQKVGQVLDARLDPQTVKDKGTGEPRTAFFLIVTAEIDKRLVLRTDCQVFAEGPPLGGDGIMKVDLGKAKELIIPGQVIVGAEPAGFGAILASLQGEFDGNNPDSLMGHIKSQLDPDSQASLMAKLLQSASDINAITASLSRELTPQDKETLLARIREVVDNINTTTAALRGEMETNKSTALLGKVHLAMDTMNAGLTSVTGLLKSGEPKLSHTIENIEETSENIARETNPAVADSLMAHFKQASAQLNDALSDINTVTATTRQVVVLNRENINKLLLNFKEASDHIKTGVKYVLQHPWRLLNEPKPSEMKQQAIFDAARSFSEAAGQIDDATAQLRALAELHGGAIPTNDPDLIRIQSDLNQTRDKYKKVEDELWRQLGIIDSPAASPPAQQTGQR